MIAVIYDFDGTLFHSPDREKGEVAYLEATGELWPFDGWFGRIEFVHLLVSACGAAKTMRRAYPNSRSFAVIRG